MSSLTTNAPLLRWALAVTLLAHGVPPFVEGSITGFGQYLNETGFAPAGLPLAWAIKLSHIGAAVCLLLNRYVRWAGAVTIPILVVGIITIHFAEGWYVVGGGRNGVEFNFLLIFALLTVMFPRGFRRSSELAA